MMVLGMLFRKLGWMDEEFASKMNKFVFLIPLPVLLFGDLEKVDFEEVWNIKFVIFCFVVTFICIAIAALLSCAWQDRSIQGEFIQASYRSSAALLGIAFIMNQIAANFQKKLRFSYASNVRGKSQRQRVCSQAIPLLKRCCSLQVEM